MAPRTRPLTRWRAQLAGALPATLASALGAVIVVAGGLVLTRGDPMLRDFTWLFVAGHAASPVAMLAAGLERPAGRDAPRGY